MLRSDHLRSVCVGQFYVMRMCYFVERGEAQRRGGRGSSLEAEERGLRGSERQEATEELWDGEALGRGRKTHMHLWERRPGLAQVDDQGSQAQHVGGTQAWALKWETVILQQGGRSPLPRRRRRQPYLVTE